MNQIITFIFSSRGLRTSLSVAASNISASIIAAITILVTSRYLGPSQFGIFASLSAFYLLINRISELGMNLAFQRYVTQQRSIPRETVQSIFWIKGLIWLCMLILSLLFHNVLQSWLHTTSTNIFLIMLALPGLMAYELINTILQAKHHFSQSNLLNLLQALLKLTAVIIAIYNHILSPVLTLYIYLITPPLVCLIYLKNSRYADFKINLKIPSPIFNTIKWTSIAAIAAALADNFDVLMIQKYLDPTQTGLFAAASRLAIFASIIGTSLGTVLSIRVAKYNQENLQQYIKKALPLSLLILASTFVGAPLAPFIIKMFLSNQYVGSSQALTILLIATGIDVATTPFIALFYKFNKPQFYAISGCIIAGLIIATNYILIPQAGIQGAAYAKLITRSIHALFVITYTYYAYKNYQNSVLESKNK